MLASLEALSLSRIPLTIAQLSDIHLGGPLSFEQEQMTQLVEHVRDVEPDVVVVAGDLTTAGYEWEYEEAAAWLETIEFPKVVIPGNHDARNVGYLHFRDLFGEPFSRHRGTFDAERSERLQATGFTIVGLDSSEPDVNEGRIGRDRVPIPGTGRERNTVTDAGDLLLALTDLDVDVVLSGHKHVPFFWGVNGMLICNSGTAATKRVRGSTPPSWNELRIDASTIKVFVHYEDGRRELAVVFSRKTRALTRESFTMTDDFLRSNRIVPAA
jgi:Icc protein